jgi:hypothetical protein
MLTNLILNNDGSVDDMIICFDVILIYFSLPRFKYILTIFSSVLLNFKCDLMNLEANK